MAEAAAAAAAADVLSWRARTAFQWAPPSGERALNKQLNSRARAANSNSLPDQQPGRSGTTCLLAQLGRARNLLAVGLDLQWRLGEMRN